MTAEDPVRALEAWAERTFTRWDPALWRATVGGPARRLSTGLVEGGGDRASADALLGSYLRLCAEGIGRGYLVPAASSGASTFANRAFFELIPDQMAAVAAPRRAEVLASLWNLAENLDSAVPWLQRVVHRASQGWTSLGDLGGEMRSIEVRLGGHGLPALGTGGSVRRQLVDLAPEDAEFLPGKVAFVTPTVVCVHDRLRDGRSGRSSVAYGLWLDAEAVPLGAMPRLEPLIRSLPVKDDAWSGWCAGDRRFTGRHGAVRVPHAVVASLETSRYVAIFRGGGA